MEMEWRTCCAAGAILVAAAIGGQVGLAAAQEGTLQIYSAYPDEHMAALVEAFEAKHPNADVQVSVQPGEQLLSTLELELRANNPQADVVGLNQASIAALARSHDAFAAYEPDGIEGIRESVRDPQNQGIPACVNIYLIQYNTNKISEEDAPQSWQDLLDSKWQNQIAMADPASSQSIHSFIWFITEYLPAQGVEGYGWDYFNELSKNEVRLEGSHGTIRDLTAAGERPIGINLLANAQTSANRGDPTSVVWPTPGSPGEVSSFAMLKSTDNREAAEAWLDFIASAEAQKLMPDALGCAPVRSDIDYAFPDGTAVGEVEIVPVDSDYISANRQAQVEGFNQAFGR